MKTRMTLAAIAALGTAGAASAAFTGVSVQATEGVIAGTTTYLLFANFDDPTENLLAVSGNAAVSALTYETLSGDGTLVQNAPGLENLAIQDVPFSAAGPGDSWVTIGGDYEGGLTDTTFSPGFLGGAAGLSVINGDFFSQADNGGYFDFDPSTPEAGGMVAIAQFTIASDAVAQYSGTADYVAAGGLGATSEAFSVILPAPGAMALLGLAGLAGTRRRRG